jgi:thiosulfate dehydrogenase
MRKVLLFIISMALLLASCSTRLKWSHLTEQAYGLRVVPEKKAYANISNHDILDQHVKRGEEIFAKTAKMLPAFVGDGLSCSNCHLKEGRTPFGLSLVGVVNRYPRYTKRDRRIINLRQRIEECFERSEQGHDIPMDGKAMNDLLAYLKFISKNTPPGTIAYGYGLIPLKPNISPNLKNGRKLYFEKCALCHGKNEEVSQTVPPLWGNASFPWGAGMSKLPKLTRFIYANMPYGSGFSLTLEEAQDVAAFILSHPRPIFKMRRNKNGKQD